MTATALQTTGQSSREIQWSEPELPERLVSLLDQPNPFGEHVPAISDVEAIAAQHALSIYEQHPKGSTHRQINKMIVKLSLGFPNQRVSDAEAEARLELYCENLSDIDIDVLGEGFRAAVRTCRFFPSVSELRELAYRQPIARHRRMARLRALLAEHHRKPEPEPQYCTPEEMAAIKAEYGLTSGSILDRIVGSQAA